MKTSEVLDRSADLLEGRWGQGSWINRESGQPVCLEGGIMAALGMNPWEGNEPFDWDAFTGCSAYKAVATHLDGYPHEWNDEGGRTEEEVVSLLREVAEIERAKEGA